jgi:hypothetical protein
MYPIKCTPHTRIYASHRSHERRKRRIRKNGNRKKRQVGKKGIGKRANHLGTCMHMTTKRWSVAGLPHAREFPLRQQHGVFAPRTHNGFVDTIDYRAYGNRYTGSRRTGTAFRFFFDDRKDPHYRLSRSRARRGRQRSGSFLFTTGSLSSLPEYINIVKYIILRI